MAAMTIRQLPPVIVNRIAAGEVVERPASAVKELVENAIDAGASRIDVTLVAGGQSLIVVSDDGAGMTRDELALAVERHCTSKLPDDDLLRIRSLGFRGEALPSIGAVSRLAITSRRAGAEAAWCLAVEGGTKREPVPAAHPSGTRVEVRDLFYATPARLKFLKSARAERDQAIDAVKRLAMAYPGIAFSVTGDENRMLLRLGAAAGPLAGDDSAALRRARLAAILGADFADNALAIDQARDGVRLTGLAGLPTLNRATARDQYLFVNGRPVRDKLLTGAVRGAYQDFLARDRHPMVALFVDLPGGRGRRQRPPRQGRGAVPRRGLVRGLIVGALRHALDEAGHRAATTVASDALAAFRRRRRRSAVMPTPRPIRPASPRRRRPMTTRPRSAMGSRWPRRDGPRRRPRRRRSPSRSARRGRSCTRPMSSPRPTTASSSSISTPRTSGWSMSA